MAIISARRHFPSSSLAPPPSPVPTAKGSRSAAVDDQILSTYLDKSLQIPDLTLPKSPFHRSAPEDIDYRSLKTRDSDSIHRILRSAKEFGVFRISGIGVSTDEVRSTVTDVESIFAASNDGRRKFWMNYECEEAVGNKDEFVWVCSREEMVEWAKEAIGCERYQSFSKKTERISRKLYEVTEALSLVFCETGGWAAQVKTTEVESVVSIFRYRRDSRLTDDILALPNERNSKSGYHSLILHLPTQHCEFHTHSHQVPISFLASPGCIVATIGEQLEEWSQGELKSISREFLLDSELNGSQACFSIVLRCYGLHKTSKIISISDQKHKRAMNVACPIALIDN